MALAQTLTALEVVKPIAKIIPIVGTSLEALVEIIIEGCKIVESVRSNKAASIALSNRAALLGVAIVRELLKLDSEALECRVEDINELLRLIREIRDLHRHHANRWWLSRNLHKDHDKEDIEVFSAKLDKAIECFNVSSLVSIKGGLDTIIAGLGNVKAEQAKIQETQVKITTSQTVIQSKQVKIAASQATIEGTVLSSEERDLLDTLKPINDARHDVQNAPFGCLQGTREQTIDLLVDWAVNNTEQSIFWLSGLGGIGKTTVIKSVCDKLAGLAILGAAFFISRSSAERTNPQNVIRSIVHQLAYYQPLLRPAICEAIRKDPMIVSQAMSFQIPMLLCAPLRLCATSLERPVVLVIDALDECDKDDSGRFGSDLLPLLLSTFSESSLPVKILVTSRVERSIQNIFSQIKPAQFRLHQIDRSIIQTDIRLYLEYNFRAIATQRITGSEDSWPGKEIIDHITNLSGGLFIFAVTVIKYVRHPRHLPNARLNELLARKPDNKHKPGPSFDDLDKLYTYVLQNALGDDPRHHDEIGQRLRTLLGVLMVLFKPLSVASLACLLDCSADLLRLDLESLSAVILVPEEGSTNTIQFFHPSFQNYLSDPSRCTDPRFLIGGTQEFHELVTIHGFKLQLDHLKDDKHNPRPDSNNIILPYILRHVRNHRDMLNAAAMKKVIIIQQECLLYCRAGHPDRPDLVSGLGQSLLLNFYRGGGPEFLQAAIDRGREALDLCPPGHPTRGGSLDNLANALLTQFEQAGGARVLAEAISLYHELLELCPPGYPTRNRSLNNLASALFRQFEQTGGAHTLAEAIELHRESLELCPSGHPYRDESLNNLANALLRQFERTGGAHVLAEAIGLHREALGLRPTGYPARYGSLNNLANALLMQFEQTGGAHALAEAIGLHREALELRPVGYLSRDISLNNLANALLRQFERTGGAHVLAEAIGLYRESLELRPLGHPSRNSSLDNLAYALKTQFEQTGGAHVLAEAISLHREALELTPPGHPSRDSSLHNLANALQTQFDQTGATHVLVAAIALHRESLELRPPGHPTRNNSLKNLANALKTQFEQTGGAHVLAEAIGMHREALELCPPGHPTRDIQLESLSKALGVKFEHDKERNTLEEAIYFAREALDLRPTGHRHHQDGLSHLASLLETYASKVEGKQASVEAERLRNEADTVFALCTY